VTITSPPSHGTINLNPVTGQVTYTPNPGYSGTDHFSYTVCDKTSPVPLCSTPATVAVTVTAPVLPTPVGDSGTTTAGTSITLSNITANDLAGTYAIDPGSVDLDSTIAGTQTTYNVPGKGTYTVNSTGQVTFTPVSNFSGIVTDNYTLADIYGNRSATSAMITITVNPVAGKDSVSTASNTATNLNVISMSQGNLDPTKVNITSPPSHGTITVNPVTGLVTYTPAPGYSGTDHFSYSVCDKSSPVPLCSSPATIAVTVNPAILPIPVADAGTTTAGTAIVLPNITSNDLPGTYALDPNTIDLDSTTVGTQNTYILAGKGTYTVNGTGQVTFTPVANFSGIVTDNYTVADIYGNRSTKSALITITVDPVAGKDSVSTGPNAATTVNVIPISQGNLDPTKVTITSSPGHGTLTLNPVTGQITYTPNPGYAGTDHFSYTVCDKSSPVPLCSTPATVAVTVTGPVLPVPVGDTGTTTAGTAITLSNIVSNDIAGTNPLDPNSIDLDSIQAGIQKTFTVPYEGTFTVNSSGQLIFTPSANFSGIVTDNYTISDIYGNRSQKSAPITITVNPVANNMTVGTGYNSPNVISVLNPDAGNLNPGSITIVSQPAHGKLSINPQTGQVTYTPNLNYSGTDNFSYTVCDFTAPVPLCSNQAMVTINVRPPTVDLALAKTAPAQVNADTYNYSLTVTNLSLDSALKIIVTDTLPTGMSYVSFQTNVYGATAQFNSATNVFTWSIPSMKGDTAVNLILTVNTTQIGPITNTASVTAQQTDPNTSNNVSSVTINKLGDNLFFPTLFTPNGDGINDYFVIKGLLDYPENELQIFNRWGNQVYHATSYMQNGNLWNGENLNEGTYYYVLKVNINGTNKVFGGYTTLIRGGR
jgi:gliding motility-associated-like protein